MSPEPWADAVARLQALALPYPVQYPAEEFSEPDFAIWLSCQGESFIGVPVEMGSGIWEERGQFLVSIFVPSGQGSTEARAIGKQIATAYRGVTGGPVVYRSATIGDGGPFEDAKYWQFTVSINWVFTDHPS